MTTAQVEFYEIAKKLSGQAGWRLLDFLFEYKGVAKMPVANKDGPVPGEKELLIMRNLFDGKKKLRLLDIKVGQYTADANWRGKSTFAAYKQSIVDSATNSAREGYRMEGFDGCPRELATFDPTEESGFLASLISQKKAKRVQFQSMPAKRFLSWFIDCREATEAPDYNVSTHVSNAEYAEAVLRAIVVKLATLARALREVPVPQKWLGSSIALLFDAGQLPARGGLEAAAQVRV
jgi:hypothetical protein